ncbi:hypothetical protein Cgig2_007985 [Carnegiea gigantea]|uniref:Sugar phosphate transporter domain-containing protein n=1 Tax=Carnegiea gigantea TaxID=171969 RepID=A0A9Q1GRU9_9CARY|nr:hypothetical protein Cgig2_007985 [Carnegiea gigantea]
MKSSSNNNKLFTIGLVAACYSSNIGILLLNRYLLSNYGFKCPIFLMMCHMTACSLLSYITITRMKMVPMQTIRSRVQFFKISALSLILYASVSGNVSLTYLPFSFNQAIGATTFFRTVFSYLMTVKKEACLTYITLILVVTEVIIASRLTNWFTSFFLMFLPLTFKSCQIRGENEGVVREIRYFLAHHHHQWSSWWLESPMVVFRAIGQSTGGVVGGGWIGTTGRVWERLRPFRKNA